MHKLTLGIEHLFTGILIECDSNMVFTYDSPSIVKITAPSKICAYWPVKQTMIESTELTAIEVEEIKKERYGEGAAEYHAVHTVNKLGEAALERYKSPTVDGEPIMKPCVFRALMNKHGKGARGVLSRIKWDRMMGCWWYTENGMYMEVEQDGYIHS